MILWSGASSDLIPMQSWGRSLSANTSLSHPHRHCWKNRLWKQDLSWWNKQLQTTGRIIDTFSQEAWSYAAIWKFAFNLQIKQIWKPQLSDKQVLKAISQFAKDWADSSYWCLVSEDTQEGGRFPAQLCWHSTSQPLRSQDSLRPVTVSIILGCVHWVGTKGHKSC